MLQRREFLAFAAAIPAIVDVRTRSVKVEKAFDSPGPKPNGLQATSEGLWILDQGENRAYLVDYKNGNVLHAVDTASDRGSGITFDGEAIWLASTFDEKIIRSDAKTGKTISEYYTPGSGPSFHLTSDVPWRYSPLVEKPTYIDRTDSKPKKGRGAHGLEWRNGKLWMAGTPSRMVYRINPKTWLVEHRFPEVGSRGHGIGWDGKWLWCTDSNLNAFFKHDPTNGEIVEKIQLADSDPLPHGMTIWQKTMWYCDDVGVVCRLKL